jgi:hypothetical protein
VGAIGGLWWQRRQGQTGKWWGMPLAIVSTWARVRQEGRAGCPDQCISGPNLGQKRARADIAVCLVALLGRLLYPFRRARLSVWIGRCPKCIVPGVCLVQGTLSRVIWTLSFRTGKENDRIPPEDCIVRILRLLCVTRVQATKRVIAWRAPSVRPYPFTGPSPPLVFQGVDPLSSPPSLLAARHHRTSWPRSTAARRSAAADATLMLGAGGGACSSVGQRSSEQSEACCPTPSSSPLLNGAAVMRAQRDPASDQPWPWSAARGGQRSC